MAFVTMLLLIGVIEVEVGCEFGVGNVSRIMKGEEELAGCIWKVYTCVL